MKTVPEVADFYGVSTDFLVRAIAGIGYFAAEPEQLLSAAPSLRQFKPHVMRVAHAKVTARRDPGGTALRDSWTTPASSMRSTRRGRTTATRGAGKLSPALSTSTTGRSIAGHPQRAVGFTCVPSSATNSCPLMTWAGRTNVPGAWRLSQQATASATRRTSAGAARTSVRPI